MLRHGEPIFPKIKVLDARRDIAFNAMDTSERWHEPSPPGEYVATAWIPGNLLNEGSTTVDIAVCSLEAPKLRHHVNERTSCRSTYTTPPRETQRGDDTSASGGESCARCSSGRALATDLAGASVMRIPAPLRRIASAVVPRRTPMSASPPGISAFSSPVTIAAEPVPGVNLVGFLQAELGIGEAARKLGRGA